MTTREALQAEYEAVTEKIERLEHYFSTEDFSRLNWENRCELEDLHYELISHLSGLMKALYPCTLEA